MHDSQPPIQFEEAPSTVNATYVDAVRDRTARAGAKLGQFFTLNVTQPYFLQRLTERSYFFGGGFYTATFYVGDEGRAGARSAREARARTCCRQSPRSRACR